MHTYLLINDSEKKGLTRSQRILAKYLPQVGPASYMGSLSQDALTALQAELAAARSRYLSVACYVVKHDLAPEIIWITGSKRNFDEDMSLYAHRWRTVKPTMSFAPQSATSRLLQGLLRVAALTHDLGKMSDAFQSKLWGACSGASTPKGEFIRHDAMSYLLIRAIAQESLADLAGLADMDGTALAEKVKATSAVELQTRLAKLLNADLNDLQRLMSPPGRRPGPSREKAALLLLAMLSLSHHRLPGAGRHSRVRNYSYDASLVADNYVNPAMSAAHADCLRFSGGNIFEDARLAQALRAAVSAVTEALAELPSDFDMGGLARLVFQYARPVLVLSDYLASGLKSGEPVAPGAMLGNTVRGKDENTPSRPGDTLVTHVLSVYHHVRQQAQLALNLTHNLLDGFPGLSIAAQRSIDRMRLPGSQFGWQYDAYSHLKKTAAGRPTLVLVTAGTGSGKTIASAQIMRALGSDRWTYCLGLRSLTLQTGKSYQKDLGLGPNDLTVVIGDSVSKKTFEAQDAMAKQGSESYAQEEFLTYGAATEAEWVRFVAGKHKPAEVARAFSAHKLNLITAPVVVCTIDQLIKTTKLASVTAALEFKRMQSADLVLDEVDNYSADELKQVVRLCFLAGLSRKNLVCLSATLGYQHTQAIVRSYQDGIRLSSLLTGLSADFVLSNVSNVADPSSVEATGHMPVAALMTAVAAYNKKTCASQAALQAKALYRTLNCTARDYDHILAEALALHEDNAYSVGDARVSVGFARMNTVASARRLAKYLYETTELPPDTELALVCYHSKYSSLELSVIDRTLDELTNRKGLPAGQELSAKAIESYVEPLRLASGKSNLLFIVVTTSIMETGRDHDYDWAILEPLSHRSLIQAAGRVRRHRGPRADGKVNVSIIAYPERALSKSGIPEAKSPINVFSRPGILTPLATGGAANTEAGYQAMLARAASALAVAHPSVGDMAKDCTAAGFTPAYPDGIRSEIALRQPAELDNNLAILEQYVLHLALNKPAALDARTKAQTDSSAEEQLSCGLCLSDWAYLDSFRGDDQLESPRLYLVQASAEEFNVLGVPVSEAGKEAMVTCDKVKAAHAWRSLTALGRTETTASAATIALTNEELARLSRMGFKRWELLHLASYSVTSFNAEPGSAYYNPLLGFNNKEAR